MTLLFEFVQIIYWLALSTWFGGVLFIAIAWPIIFRTVRENDPVLPTVLSVNLEGQHGSLLAGTIVANLITMLTRVQLICAGAVLITIAVQLAFRLQEPVAAIPRVILFIAAVALLIYDWRFIAPRIEEQRQLYLDHADEPDVANAARQKFDQYHRQSVLLLMILLALLLGMIVFSTTIAPAMRAFLSS
jgi:hypothetical protein